MASKPEVLRRFEVEGISIAEWARAHGYNYRTVIAVLHGRLKGSRGKSHQIAVALRLKPKGSRKAGG